MKNTISALAVAAAAGGAAAGDIERARHAFDFLHGEWTVQNRRQSDYSNPDSPWETFSASNVVHALPAGIGNYDEYRPLDGWRPVFEAAGVPLDLVDDARPVQWGKLLLNLNNPVNALSGLPLRAQLMQRGYRRCFAALMEEALAVLARAGIAPAQVAALPPRRLLAVLRLPSPLFRIVAARMLKIDAKARSSMADDLALGRRTEVDALCGEVVRLARAHGMQAPRNARMVELLDVWPQAPGRLSPAAMMEALGL